MKLPTRRQKKVRVGRRTLEISRPSKVLFPESGITKGDLVDHYRRIADVMLPHMRDRPATLQRFPDGISKKGFYQKQASEYFPDWVRRAEVEKEDGTLEHVLVDGPETLVYLANQACVTWHLWLSRIDRPRQPDRLIFDLDPSTDDLKGLRRAVRSVRGLLEELGLRPFLMTTGSRGFHVLVPLRRNQSFEEVRAFARGAAELAARREPERLTSETRKAARGDRVFIDYLRNGYAQTAVAPYSVRARPGAPVATPLDWSELAGARPDSYRLDNIFRRLGQKSDPWARLQDQSQDLRSAGRRLGESLS